MLVVLIKNLRATAGLKVYDCIFNLDSMKFTDMKIVLYNGFHGTNPDKICVWKLNSYLKDKPTTLGCTMNKCPS